MAWYSRKKKKAKKYLRKYGRKAIRGGRFLGRNTPYGRAYTVGSWAYRNRKKAKQFYDSADSYYESIRHGKSRGDSSPQSRRSRRKPRGKYYYYRGKRIYYQPRRQSSRRRRRY